MRIRKNKNTGPDYLIRFARTYLLMMVISFLVAMTTYYIAIKAVEDYAIDANTSLLEYHMNAIEYRMDEIDTMAKLLFTNPKILAFNDLDNPYAGSNVLELMNLRKALAESYPLNDSLIKDFYICYNKSQIAVSRYSIYSLKELHANNYSFTDYDLWKEDLLGYYRSGKYLYPDKSGIEKGSVPFMTYTQSIGTSRRLIGSILIQIDNTRLSESIMEKPEINKGFMYIRDENANLISSYSYGNESFVHFVDEFTTDSGYLFKDYNGEKYLITYITSSETGWTYTDIKPVGETMENVYRIQQITFLIIILASLVGLIVAYLVAKINVKPIDKLISSNALLQKEIIEQLPILRITFIERLISGLITNESDLIAQCDHLGISLDSLISQAIVIKVTGYDQYQDKITIQQLSLERLQLTAALKSSLGPSAILHNIETDKILLLLDQKELENSSVTEYLRDTLEDTLVTLSQKINIETVIGIGEFYDSLMDIHSSYKEALQAISFRLYHKEEQFALYSDLPKSNDIFFFPSNIESKLINLIKAGDLENVNQLLKDIYEENIIKRQLSPSMISNLLNLMWSTNIKLIDDLMLDDMEIMSSIQKTSEEFTKYSDIEKLQRTMDYYRTICEKMKDGKKSNNQSLISHIIIHIKDNIADADLSLIGVADVFDITDVYLSVFFKEQTGINFSKYIEQLRMDIARQMLSESDALINEIVRTTGYHSSNAFGRAFKRINGMSATDYRQTFKQ